MSAKACYVFRMSKYGTECTTAQDPIQQKDKISNPPSQKYKPWF